MYSLIFVKQLTDVDDLHLAGTRQWDSIVDTGDSIIYCEYLRELENKIENSFRIL